MSALALRAAIRSADGTTQIGASSAITTQHALKLHALLDLRGNIPTFIWITPAQLHDVNVLDHLTPEAGAFHGSDRGHLDFERLSRF